MTKKTARQKTPDSAPNQAPGPDLSHIAEQLRPLAVRCDSLVLDPQNARLHPEKNLEGIKGSLRSFRQDKSIVVRREGMVVCCGNGTLEAARALGWEWIAATVESMTDDQFKARSLADNRVAELAVWDPEVLAAATEGLKVADPDLQALLDDLAAGEAPMRAQPEDESDLFEKEFSVLIKCRNEPDQKAVLEELDRHGLNLRALVVDYPVSEKKEETPGPELPADGVEIVRTCEITRTARTMQLEGLFDVPPAKQAEQRWRIACQLDRPWGIGLIVGASGSGKSTVARELFGDKLVGSWPWSEGKAIVDDFPESLGIAEITGLLSSVGFSSPPSWLKPFHVLSNGEQFRVNLARTLAEQPDLAVVDEFTSVVDRTVAQIGSAALAKAVRSSGKKFIAVSCHHDIEEWLQPDWKLEMPGGALVWRSLRRRPEISLHVRRCDARSWALFAHHHYLNHGLNGAAQCFMASVNGRPAAFTAAIHYPNAFGGFWREHRTVCLPDFQGVGVGIALSEFVAAMYTSLKSYHSTTSHPAMIRHRLRSPLWRCIRKPSFNAVARAKAGKVRHKVQATTAAYRYTAGFEFIGPALPDEAADFGVIPAK